MSIEPQECDRQCTAPQLSELSQHSEESGTVYFPGYIAGPLSGACQFLLGSGITTFIR